MSISIVIPTWNEADRIATTIRSLRQQAPLEIIVADGGSTDATRSEACNADHVLTCAPGRAAQMNAGAARARGDTLLFLHADCTLEPGALHVAEKTLTKPDVIAGCFAMRVKAEGLAYRCIDACAAARVRLTGIAYGDQGLFLHRHDFERLGGFPPLDFMEDVFFSRCLRRAGRIVVVNKTIFTSARRWQIVGLVRQTLTNWTLTGLTLAGVSPNQLSQFYPRNV